MFSLHFVQHFQTFWVNQNNWRSMRSIENLNQNYSSSSHHGKKLKFGRPQQGGRQCLCEGRALAIGLGAAAPGPGDQDTSFNGKRHVNVDQSHSIGRFYMVLLCFVFIVDCCILFVYFIFVGFFFFILPYTKNSWTKPSVFFFFCVYVCWVGISRPKNHRHVHWVSRLVLRGVGFGIGRGELQRWD